MESRAVGEADAVEGVHRPQVDVVAHLATAQRPQLLEQERRRDDGRAGVEREAVLSMDGGAAARGVELLEHRHPIAASAETNGRGQPAEAATDHNGPRSRDAPSI